ncbi:hypothetical protein ADN00_03175 [Ornatilinea apprima]|uniref:ATPase P n=1 Tax=Ornatilinea apprima TaxID=1134406 RepID=A0A0P6XVL5_9CHLR|nr:HAD family hydrolase [Ornatilinea apprima]KPL79342.1 hypothetical protein ADN00_03175 [Ornatilinea apprima]
MIRLNIPGRDSITLRHLVCDVNGTLAVDGILQPGVAERFARLKNLITIHLLTADTHGRQHQIDEQLGLRAVRISPGNEAGQKAEFVRQLGAPSVAAIGQGANDAAMLKLAALGICVLSTEGLAVETLLSADLLMPDIDSALELFEHPARITASLRK